MPSLNRLGFLSAHDPHDRTAFSGSSFHAARALKAACEGNLAVLGPHRPMPALIRRLRRKLPVTPPTPLDFRPPAGLDAVVALVASELLDTLLPISDVPMVHVTDATPLFLQEFYGYDIPDEVIARERRVVRQAALTVYSSEYMARRAIDELQADPGRIAVVPFGINLDHLPSTRPAKASLETLNLLYIGTNWARKGGDVALEAFAALRRSGRNARLTLVGERPPGPVPDGVEVLGFLDKNRPAQTARLTQALTAAHLLVLPTRADCTPMVIAEANAHGAPVLATDLGGIPSLMAPGGGNGTLLPPEAPPTAWAEAMAEMTADATAWMALSRTSFEHARSTLTWEAWAGRVMDALRAVQWTPDPALAGTRAALPGSQAGARTMPVLEGVGA